MLLKLRGAISLVLIESNESECRKCLVRESSKWLVHVTCEKGVYGAMNAALIAHKNWLMHSRVGFL